MEFIMKAALQSRSGLRRSSFAKFRRKASGLLAAAGLALLSSHALAEDCTPYVSRMYAYVAPGPSYYYNVSAVRMTARGAAGFSSFSMGPSYSPSVGIATRPTPHLFSVSPDSTGSVVGKFQEVFPGRTDGSSDLTTLKVSRSGTVQLKLDEWGGVLVSLTNVQCYPGHTGKAFLLTGSAYSSGYGRDLWTFLFIPAYFG